MRDNLAVDDACERLVHGETDFVPVTLDEHGEHGRIVWTVRYEAHAHLVGECVFRFFENHVGVFALVGEERDVFSTIEAVLDVADQLLSEDVGQHLVDFAQLREPVRHAVDAVAEARRCDGNQVVGA